MLSSRQGTWTLIAALALAAVFAALLIGNSRRGGTIDAVSPDLDNTLQIGGVVFEDADQEGALSPGDAAISQAPIEVLNRALGERIEATTDADGSFVVDIGGLPEALVEVEISLPAPTSGSEKVTVVRIAPAVAGEVIEIPVTPWSVDCDPRRCPELLLPDLISLAETPGFLDADQARSYPGPDQWEIDTTTEPGRRLLRVATMSANAGDGPLLLVGTDEMEGRFTAAAQRLLTNEGGYRDVTSGTFAPSDSHEHVHLEQFEQIRLLDGEETISASKISFCLTDVVPLVESDRPDPPGVALNLELFDCGTSQQGINVDRVDYYGPSLPDQFIDITGVPPGNYTLEITVDPDDVLVESDETNNTVAFPITLP